MAKQTWNVDRKKGGTFSFKLDAQGNYTLQKDGFGSVKTLNLPELKAEDTKTTTTQDTKKISDQTQKAFGDVQPFYYDKKGGGGDQYTSEYQMQKEGDLATDQAMTKGDNFAQARQAMTSDAAYRGVTPSDRQPGFEVANKGIAKQDTTPAWAQGVDKRGYEKIGKDTSIKATDQIGRTNVDKVLAERAQADRFGTGEWGPKPSKGMPQQSPYQDAIMRGQTGVKYEKPGVPQKVSQLTTTALKKVNTGLKPLAKAVGFVMSPVTSTIGMVAGALKEDATQKHAKNYFNAGDDGRIAGNPATDLYAGLNRVSAFGNLEVTGKNRIANRQKTAAKYAGKWSKERMDKFNNTTKEMEKQQDKYTRDKHEAVAKDAISKGAYAHNPAEMHAASKKASGNGGGTGCFLKGTQVTMFDGSTKPVEQVDLGDEVAVGGNVFAVGKFLNTELYDYKGIKVSGSHMVNEDGIWMRVRDTKHGISLGDDLNTVYVFGSENRRILINDILFTDYFEVSEQDKLVDNPEDFFNNWKDYGNNVDVDNVATLNMTYEI